MLGRYLQHVDREHFVTSMLYGRNQIIGIQTVSLGCLFAAIVSPREVFKAAIPAKAAGTIVAHNHRSGDVTPSPEDIHVTNTLKEAGKVLDIEVLEHLIIDE